MMRSLALLAICAATLAACASAGALPTSLPAEVELRDDSEGRLKLHHSLVREQRPVEGASIPTATCTPGDMTLHNIPTSTIAPTLAMTGIFWGTSWKTYTGDIFTGIDAFFRGYGGSAYAATANQYRAANGAVGSKTTYRGVYALTSTQPPANPDYNNAASKAYLDRTVCILVTGTSIFASTTPQVTDFIALFSSLKRPATGAASKFCGWHSFAVCNGVKVPYAFLHNLQGDAGCNPQDFLTGNSQGLAATANILAHELHETRTDPHLDAWFDNCGNEVGDKCNFIFPKPYVTLLNGRKFKLQAQWSNAASKAGTGYPDRNGRRGCVLA